MKPGKNIYQILSRKITINLAQQHEILHNHDKLLESRIEHLLKEVKALTEENSDLKEIVYALNQENEHYRKGS